MWQVVSRTGWSMLGVQHTGYTDLLLYTHDILRHLHYDVFLHSSVKQHTVLLCVCVLLLKGLSVFGALKQHNNKFDSFILSTDVWFKLYRMNVLAMSMSIWNEGIIDLHLYNKIIMHTGHTNFCLLLSWKYYKYLLYIMICWYAFRGIRLYHLRKIIFNTTDKCITTHLCCISCE